MKQALEGPSLQTIVAGPNKKPKKSDPPTFDELAQVAALVAAKYHHAGGSVRWMFEVPFRALEAEIKMHLDRVIDYTDIFRGRQDNLAVNHLRGATKVNGTSNTFSSVNMLPSA